MRAQVIEHVVPLASNGTYTSGTRDMLLAMDDFGIAYTRFVVEVDSDQAGTVEVDQSTDMIIWAAAQTAATYTAASGILHLSVLVPQRYARVVFTNGATAQTRFTMTTGVDRI